MWGATAQLSAARAQDPKSFVKVELPPAFIPETGRKKYTLTAKFC
jgi:hypothetical protein